MENKAFSLWIDGPLHFEEVAYDLIHTKHQDVVHLWYKSRDPNIDLLLWKDVNNQIIKQQIIVLGSVVEWNVVEGIKTGCILEEENHHEILWDQDVHKGFVGKALQSLRQAAGIREKEEVLRLFETGPRMEDMDPQFLLRYYESLRSQKTKSAFWKKALHVFSYLKKLLK